MKVLYINPNSTEAMTRSVVEVARHENPDCEILGWTNANGPPAIEGPEDGAAAIPGMLALLPMAEAEGADVIVIACFDDTGLAEVRAKSHCPVLGIGQAAYVAANLLGHRFAVVTTLEVSAPVIERNIAEQGFSANCTAVHASGLPVLVVEEGSEETRAQLADHIRETQDRHGATAAILGCAGMARLRDDLSARSGVPLIDGVAASAQLAPALARLA